MKSNDVCYSVLCFLIIGFLSFYILPTPSMGMIPTDVLKNIVLIVNRSTVVQVF